MRRLAARQKLADMSSRHFAGQKSHKTFQCGFGLVWGQGDALEAKGRKRCKASDLLAQAVVRLCSHANLVAGANAEIWRPQNFSGLTSVSNQTAAQVRPVRRRHLKCSKARPWRRCRTSLRLVARSALTLASQRSSGLASSAFDAREVASKARFQAVGPSALKYARTICSMARAPAA